MRCVILTAPLFSLRIDTSYRLFLSLNKSHWWRNIIIDKNRHPSNMCADFWIVLKLSAKKNPSRSFQRTANLRQAKYFVNAVEYTQCIYELGVRVRVNVRSNKLPDKICVLDQSTQVIPWMAYSRDVFLFSLTGKANKVERTLESNRGKERKKMKEEQLTDRTENGYFERTLSFPHFDIYIYVSVNRWWKKEYLYYIPKT